MIRDTFQISFTFGLIKVQTFIRNGQGKSAINQTSRSHRRR